MNIFGILEYARRNEQTTRSTTIPWPSYIAELWCTTGTRTARATTSLRTTRVQTTDASDVRTDLPQGSTCATPFKYARATWASDVDATWTTRNTTRAYAPAESAQHAAASDASHIDEHCWIPSNVHGAPNNNVRNATSRPSHFNG